MNGMSDANGGDANLDSMNRGDPSRRTVDVILKYLITNLYRNTWPYVIPNQTETDIPRQWPLNLSQKT